jgi:biofilm PGA synthesis N-glycosyltransferase PgaC
MILYVWFSLGLFCLGVPIAYYAYMHKNSQKPWKAKISPIYEPQISIVIPTYNESTVIQEKLENIARIRYPRNLTQVIVVDSASTDDTVEGIQAFKRQNADLSILLIEEENRKGKASALNLALSKATGEIIIVSDADCFWPCDILEKALPYFGDTDIGAVAGQEVLLNPKQSWVTKTESLYRSKMFEIQLGESKLYSTLQFEGGFGAYRRNALEQFDEETGSDDSGTALRVIQKGFRTIVIPEALFYTFFPPTLMGKIAIKTRRAHQFLRIFAKCFRLMLKHQLVLPKRILLPQAFLMLINPFFFVAFVFTSALVLFSFPLLIVAPILLILFPKTRIYLAELFQNNFIALLAMIKRISGKRAVVWRKAEDSRKSFEIKELKNNGLIG